MRLLGKSYSLSYGRWASQRGNLISATVKFFSSFILILSLLYFPSAWADPIRDLWDAVQSHDIKAVESLLKANPNLINTKYTGCCEETPLIAATLVRDFAIVKYLVSKGAEVNVSDCDGASPLHIAAAFNDKPIAEFLLSHKAKVDARSVAGTTPLFAAIKPYSKDMIILLIQNGADVNAADNFGFTPLKLALQQKLFDIADFLRKHGAKE
ncbi:MAG: ankyrin repeat domain-containing protein [Vulcanimicrobiota bacterium]